MTSKSIYQPYFYIIQHKVTKKLYAGSRWDKGCHPNEFMQPNGYTTSSSIINQIIYQEGLESFEVIRIDTNLDGLSAYEYESLFLQTINCASSIDWYNCHNNTGMSFGTIKFIEKSKETMLMKYGYKNPFQVPSFKAKIKESVLSKYGYEFITQSPDMKQKSKETMLMKYGYEHALQSPIIKEKYENTMILNYGCTNRMQVKEFKDKHKASLFKNYGVENPSQSPIIQERMKMTRISNSIENWGIDEPNKVLFFSMIENKKTYTKSWLSRKFPELRIYF